MNSYREAFDGSAFRRWLDVVTTARIIEQASPLDPFQSSMRTVRALVTAMVEMDAGRPPVAGDVPQALGDLQRAGVVVAGTLNDLGRAAVAQWRAHGVAEYFGGVQRRRRAYLQSDIFRSILLLREGLSRGIPQYAAYVERWRRLREFYRAPELIRQDPAWLLYYFSYFDRTVEDYNPWRSVAGAPIGVFTPAEDQPGVDPQARLSRTIYGYATRGNRREFCAALECITLRSARERERFLAELGSGAVAIAHEGERDEEG